MERRLQPEWLDELPAADPAAIRSRRDLRRVNTLMGHAAIAAAALNASSQSPVSLLEIGAGDGTFSLRLVRRLRPNTGERKATLLDRQNIVSEETERALVALGWQTETLTTDLFDWLEKDPESFDVILANLFLHHFTELQLQRLFGKLADRCNVFVGVEPRRAAIPFLLSHTLGFLGCNSVTRHDAVVSVRAGFADTDLSTLWPADSSWTLEEGSAGLFSHLFIARRKAALPEGNNGSIRKS